MALPQDTFAAKLGRGMSETTEQADVLVVGAGLGGATLGHALARAGRSVLFLEAGRDLSAPDALRGSPAEASVAPDRWARSGRSAEELLDLHAGDCIRPFTGAGTGGSSALYGMVMERRAAWDFVGWPFGLEELLPWYAAAEALYGVRPPAAPLSPANEKIFAHLRRQGLSPYRLPLACERRSDCRLCQGHLCDAPEGCKNDAARVCLTPALVTGRARLRTETRALALLWEDRRVTGVIAEERGQRRAFRGRIVVAAAGALATPRLLRASALPDASGLLGRRLMRHWIDVFVLAAGPRYRKPAETKELGLADFYTGPERLGLVQALGATPSAAYLRQQPGRNLWRWLGPLAAPVVRCFEGRPLIAGILDDSPDPANSIEPAAPGEPFAGRYAYRLPAPDHARRKGFGRRIRRAFARWLPVPVFGTDARKALGHVCGTAVFGVDPAHSVLDPWNRFHALDNLYVADASFFPTSGGVNPALTIAANALRLADHLHREVL